MSFNDDVNRGMHQIDLMVAAATQPPPQPIKPPLPTATDPQQVKRLSYRVMRGEYGFKCIDVGPKLDYSVRQLE